MASDPIPISNSLDDVVRSLRGPASRVVGGLFGRWEELVGCPIAEHVQPIKLDAGVLTVSVDDPAWATQLKFVMPMILDRLRLELGVVIDRYEVRVNR